MNTMTDRTPAEPGCRIWCNLGGDRSATGGACELAYIRGDASAAISQAPGDIEPQLRLRVAGRPFLDGRDVVQAVNAFEALGEVLVDLAVIGGGVDAAA